MKKFLLTLLVVLGLNVNAQDQGRVITHFTRVQSMNWSELDGKYIFIDQVARHPAQSIIETNFDFNKVSGRITLTTLESEDVYVFSIYDYNLKKADGNGSFDILRFECVENSTGEKCTIMFMKDEYGYSTIAIMMPNSNLAVWYDSYPE